MRQSKTLGAPALCCAGVLALGCYVLPAVAQEDTDPNYTVTSWATAPDSAEAERYRKSAERKRIATRMTYATGLEGDIFGEEKPAPVGEPAPSRRSHLAGGGGSVEVILVLLAMLGILGLWLRFGGSGMLLARAPREVPPATAIPESWQIKDAPRDAQTLIGQLEAMEDRRLALILLLRHCLLRGGLDTDTRFARADTEREAFARLPQSWMHHSALGQILRDAELVHYGGREVTPSMIESAFAAGRLMLKGARHDA